MQTLIFIKGDIQDFFVHLTNLQYFFFIYTILQETLLNMEYFLSINFMLVFKISVANGKG